METIGSSSASPLGSGTLKPSLVEWKRGIDAAYAVHSEALKPSLVEWKRRFFAMLLASSSALKPSLVEWKLNALDHGLFNLNTLETFLSGMETGVGRV